MIMAKKKTATSTSGEQSATLAERFLRLFRSNPRSVGRFDPERKRMHTDEQEVALSDVQRHLDGKWGLGLVPILDDDTCWWGAIDIDNHGQDEDIPIGPIDAKLVTGDLAKLVPCRSKSGGVHVYAFFAKPWAASRVRAFLSSVAAQIGYAKSEIFPKQHHLGNEKGGGRQKGNWINLPYFLSDDTVRYAYKHGKKLGLDGFLAFCEENRIPDTAYASVVAAEHPDAPPCIQRMVAEGVGKGQRNEALYQIAVYTRKAFPDAFKERAFGFNESIFERPLARSEADRTINSASRPDYRYRCGEEPARSFCDRDSCLKRKFGITPSDAEAEAAMAALPIFSDLVKYQTDPIRWEVKVDGRTITNIETENLLDWRWIRKAVAEKLTRVVPMIKNQEWERVLQPLMESARIVEAPEDSGPAGFIRNRFREFAAKAHDLRGNKNIEDRQALLRGLPILAMMDGQQHLVFRQDDFVQYLKRTKSEELKGVNLWFAIREFGVRHSRMRVSGDKAINVWALPYKEVQLPESDQIKFESEL